MNALQLPIALTLVFAGSVCAESETQIALDKISPAWQRLEGISQSYLSGEQQKTVQELAFATATADFCEGFEVDRKVFVDAFKVFANEKFNALSAEEQRSRERRLLVFYGIATGLFSAERLIAGDDFCTAAATVREKPAGRFWK